MRRLRHPASQRPRVGDRVLIHGDAGTVVGTATPEPGWGWTYGTAHIVVEFDAFPGAPMACHPTWGVEVTGRDKPVPTTPGPRWWRLVLTWLAILAVAWLALFGVVVLFMWLPPGMSFLLTLCAAVWAWLILATRPGVR